VGQEASFARDPIAARLLPVLLHRIHNATQLLGTLNSIVVETGDVGWLERKAGDLGETGETIEELGYALAVIASACGADLLLERREPEGLAILVGAVREAARRDGLELREPESALPRLAPDVLRGWELPWAVSAVLMAGAAGPAESAPDWSLAQDGASWALRIEAAPTDELRALLPLVAERLPGSELECPDERFELRLPGEWLVGA
jgi:hypothetical protein